MQSSNKASMPPWKAQRSLLVFGGPEQCPVAYLTRCVGDEEVGFWLEEDSRRRGGEAQNGVRRCSGKGGTAATAGRRGVGKVFYVVEELPKQNERVNWKVEKFHFAFKVRLPMLHINLPNTDKLRSLSQQTEKLYRGHR
jgi:hypothetical protein